MMIHSDVRHVAGRRVDLVPKALVLVPDDSHACRIYIPLTLQRFFLPGGRMMP